MTVLLSVRISNPTVEMHVAHARRKLNAATREQALPFAIVLRLISPL
jgi:DNA-binding CsgD family transcriptional regulator